MALAPRGANADIHAVQAFDQRSRVPADTFQPRRIGRLVVDEPGVRATFSAEVLDVSVRGCQLRAHTPVDAGWSARLGIEVGRTTLWVPVRTRSVRRTSHGWTIACDFDRPTAEEQRSIYVLMAERNCG